MYLRILAATAAVLTFAFTVAADAKPWNPWDDHVTSSNRSSSVASDDDERPTRQRSSKATRVSNSDDDERPARRQTASRRSSDDSDSAPSSSGAGPRPGAWCGWYMRTRHGGGPEFNLAANWRKWGSPGSPQIGAIVVWDHHVGEIVGKTDSGQWIILSGNDGGAVRTRPRSIAGATIRV